MNAPALVNVSPIHLRQNHNINAVDQIRLIVIKNVTHTLRGLIDVANFNVYLEIKNALYEQLEAKTGWGRNELKKMISDVLLEVSTRQSVADPPPDGKYHNN